MRVFIFWQKFSFTFSCSLIRTFVSFSECVLLRVAYGVSTKSYESNECVSCFFYQFSDHNDSFEIKRLCDSESNEIYNHMEVAYLAWEFTWNAKVYSILIHRTKNFEVKVLCFHAKECQRNRFDVFNTHYLNPIQSLYASFFWIH